MSGHNKWSQIKNQKGAADKKRGQLFSKLLKAISVAAKNEPNPDFNPRLRSAIEKAKENNVPKEKIERAIARAAEEKNYDNTRH
ncbi:MAG: YebC/PmpR family DNA-binding transcriptional regulator [Candidatus Harrisonbacteria bacterium]|nr:YebC/PmpR family DNA-binding transcriptional regulator [Candidatus Harrisonbacteria bacterium]